MDFLILFFLYRGGKGQTKCPISIADLVLLYNKCMEGQYCKGDILTFNLYKSCPSLKPQFVRYCKSFEQRLRSLVPDYRVIPVNEEQQTKLDVTGFITEWKSNAGKIRPHRGGGKRDSLQEKKKLEATSESVRAAGRFGPEAPA
jgi:hypothetical protein